MRTSVITITIGNPSSFAVPADEWHYIVFRHQQTSGDNETLMDATLDNPGPPTSIPSGTGTFRLGLEGGGTVAFANATIRLSNVAFYRGCTATNQLPNFPPPPATTQVQLPYLGVGP